MSAGFLAVDWGTTNRRIFHIDNGAIVRSERDNCGVTATPDFAEEVAHIRQRFGDLPMLLVGMVGSSIGWRAVPYVAAPADISDLTGGVLLVDDRTAIVPGLSFTDGHRGDVMRGEEVQVFGAASAGLAPSSGWFCQPGTHCKWALLDEGRITRFTTAMTGEIFALLGRDGLLASQLNGEVADGAAFRDGVAEGARRDVLASLFGIRAMGLLGLREPSQATSYASGLLIGADVAVRLMDAEGAPVNLVANPVLGPLYQIAIETLGGKARVVNDTLAFVAGVSEIYKEFP